MTWLFKNATFVLHKRSYACESNQSSFRPEQCQKACQSRRHFTSILITLVTKVFLRQEMKK